MFVEGRMSVKASCDETLEQDGRKVRKCSGRNNPAPVSWKDLANTTSLGNTTVLIAWTQGPDTPQSPASPCLTCCLPCYSGREASLRKCGDLKCFCVTRMLLSGWQGANTTSKSWVVLSISGANKSSSGQMIQFVKAVICSAEV